MALRVRKNKAIAPPSCALTECMSLLRGAWAPNVIWYLSEGPRRFGELRVDMPDISARVLSARLRELEARGVLARRPMSTSPPSVEYGLTDLGRELVPAIAAIVDVGRRLKERAGSGTRLGGTGKRGAPRRVSSSPTRSRSGRAAPGRKGHS
jgi:DNA-binding HxlR family transcriptional regulator